mgnify:CR=1 FL=1
MGDVNEDENLSPRNELHKKPWPRIDEFERPKQYSDDVINKYPSDEQIEIIIAKVMQANKKFTLEKMGELTLNHPANTAGFSMAKVIFLFDAVGMLEKLRPFLETMINQELIEPKDFTEEYYKKDLTQDELIRSETSERGGVSVFLKLDENDLEYVFKDLSDGQRKVIKSLADWLKLNIKFTYDHIEHIKKQRNDGNYENIANYIQTTMSVAVSPEGTSVAVPRAGGYKKRTKKPKSKKRKQTKTKKSKTKRKKTRRNKRR